MKQMNELSRTGATRATGELSAVARGRPGLHARAAQLEGASSSAVAVATQRKMLRLWDVRERTGLSESHVYGLMAQGRFPTQVRISRRCVCWFEDEIMAWMDARSAERTAA